MLQHIATGCPNICNMLCHVVPNNVARYCVEMLRAFGQAFTVKPVVHLRATLQVGRNVGVLIGNLLAGNGKFTFQLAAQ